MYAAYNKEGFITALNLPSHHERKLSREEVKKIHDRSEKALKQVLEIPK